eukprot:686228-Alexandrium_andersonii.AAC.1
MGIDVAGAFVMNNMKYAGSASAVRPVAGFGDRSFQAICSTAFPPPHPPTPSEVPSGLTGA